MSINYTLLGGDIPASWRLVPVNGRKCPVNPVTGLPLHDWTKLTLDASSFPFDSSHVKAIGVLTGPASRGLLAVDIDSSVGQELLESMTGKKLEEFPLTIACTSGKPSSQKRFYQVSDENLWDKLRTIKKKGLDILWKRCQAVLCGEHPETGSYQWLAGCSPMDCEVAEAPDWLISSLIDFREKPNTRVAESLKHQILPHMQAKPKALWGSNHKTDVQEIALARQALGRLKPTSHESYNSWLKVGMCLHSVSPSLLEDWIQWSSTMSNFDEDECLQKWSTFTDCHSYFDKTGRPGVGLGTLLSMRPFGATNAVNQQLIDAVHDKRTCNSALLQYLRSWKNIRFNELKRRVEINGEMLSADPKYFYLYLADHAGIAVRSELARDVLVTVAHENPFNPVAEYLHGVLPLASEVPSVSDQELALWFGLDYADDVSVGLLRVHLRACALRGLNPGSKMDSVLILSGAMGLRKSSIIKALPPNESWYDETTRMDIDNKDTLSAMNSTWIFELSEIEKLTATRESSALKAWVTRATDKYVEKYETVTTEHQRRTCLWGTTNAGAFLNDPTGSRRYWICYVRFLCNVDSLMENRDRLWAHSLQEALDGLPSYLNPDDKLMIDANVRGGNATFVDPWQDLLETKLEGLPAGTFMSTQKLFAMIDMPTLCGPIGGEDIQSLGQHNGLDSRRLASAMNAIGWQSKRTAKHRGYLKL